MDFHQKTLLSDEFGIGMAGLLLESFFQAGSFVDISIALNDPAIYQDIEQEGSTQPDYLMWGSGSPYYVVECKGSQCTKNTSYDQLRRGLEQVPSVVFGAGPRQVVTLVIATCLLDTGAEVFVLDPPPDPPDGEKTGSEDKVSERTGKRTWQIRNSEMFVKRSILAEESHLLKWAGQYQSAAIRDQQLERMPRGQVALVNTPLETKRTHFGNFLGVEQPMFPELGVKELRMFTGVKEEILEPLLPHPPRGIEAEQIEGDVARELPARLPANVSVSRSGTCMILEGL